MYSLELERVKQLEAKLADACIKNPSLSIDILDHLCCMIEEKIDTGYDYEKAEKEVFIELGILQIQAIEIETRILTQNKMAMKKRTKIIGVIAMSLMLTGFVMKQFHLMGADMVWTLGILVTVFGFALFLTVDRFSYDKSIREITLNIIGYLGAGAFLTGFGLKFLSWPYSNNIMIIGGFVMCIHFLINNIFLRPEKIT